MPSLPLILLALHAAAPQAAPASPCEALAQSLRGRACVAAGSVGAAVATDPARAQQLAELAGAGETAWRANYGSGPARYVVFESGTPPEVARDRATFVRAGFPVALSWQSPSAWLTSQKRLIEDNVRTQMGAFVQGPQIDQLVARIHGDLDAQNTPDGIKAREAANLPHDLGHQWLTASLWPTERSGPDHVGSPAPDWLDELGAQLAEPEAVAAKQRDTFREGYSSDAAAVSLEALFAGPIPSGGVVRMNSGATPSARRIAGQIPPGARIMSPPGGAAPAGGQIVGAPPPGGVAGGRIITGSPGGAGAPIQVRSAPHPALTRVFLDYLTAKGNGPAAVPALARAVAGGGDLAQWLAAEGAAHGLPTSTEALEADWRAWVAQTYGGTGA